MDERGRWQLVAWAVVAAVVVFLGARELGRRSDGGGAAPVAVGGPGTPAPRASAGGARSAGPGAYVHVAGAVRRPGLYRVPAGARVAVAVRRAGGPARGAQLAAVNLAARLQDGQQVVVPGDGAGAAGGGDPAAGAGTPGAAKLSLGSASAKQLEELDGIGPTLAGKIVEYRTKRGGFRSLDQLRQVDGIGEKRLQALKEGLTP
ncbi:MAG TPA: helix-hairpin-helix domain-containing protein [Thermoleophilaceae bacterium]|nr:helix-hairpin-helix domain-containing protein [Thermoleophilaceae bacterium]